MAITNLNYVAESARQRLGWSVADLPRIITMVPAALQALASQEASKRGSRHYFMTPADTVATLESDGTKDLATVITSTGLLIEKLEFGKLRHASSEFPLKSIGNSSSADLPNPYGSLDCLRYYMEGTVLHTISADDNETPLTGDVSIIAPRVPGVEELNVQERDELIAHVVLIGQGQPPKVVDNAT